MNVLPFTPSATPQAVEVPTAQSPGVSTTSESPQGWDSGAHLLQDQLAAAPQPYQLACQYICESYERTISILEAERDYLEARLEKAGEKS